MDPLANTTPEQLLAMLESIQKSGRSLEEVSPDLAALMRNVKKEKGQATEEATAGQDVTPEPGFVVKTSCLSSGRKVFLNITSSPSVPMPGSWAAGATPAEVEAALDQLDAAAEEQQQQQQQQQQGGGGTGSLGQQQQASSSRANSDLLRFPLSMGPAERDLDKKGEPCTTIDFLLHTDVVRRASSLRKLKVFLIDLALGWAEHKTGMELDRKYKLPKMKYKGDVVRSQRIRVDSSKRQPLVTEVRDVPDEPVFPLVTKKLDQQQLAAAAAAAAGQEKRQVTAAATAAAAPAAARQAAAASSTSASSWPAGGAPPASQLHSLAQHSVSYEGRPVERVVLDVPLPPAVSADSVAVSACGYDVYVRIPQCEELHVRLPLAVAPGGAGASAVVEPVPEASGGSGGGGGVQPQQHGRRLRVCLPYLPLDQLLQQMRDSAPLAFGQLQFANKSFLELE